MNNNEQMFNFNMIHSCVEMARMFPSYKKFVKLFKYADTVGYIAHGGNLAIADHAAIDASRHTGKRCLAPGSGVVTTSLFNDCGDDWQREWIKSSKCDAYVLITASASSKPFSRALEYLIENDMPYLVISGVPLEAKHVHLPLLTYHEFEVAALSMTYNILNDAGYECPKI